MKKINFLFGVHNHQPVGNFGKVFEDLYRQAYDPFLRVLRRHPKVKMTFHISGPLLEWIEGNRPDYFSDLREMAHGGQIELFTGGMYEPILPILPDRDKLGQIRMMSEYLERKFQVKAKGMWVAERVWEPHLTKTLAEAGVRYIVMDDAHFKSAGLREDQTFGYYLMEEQGATTGLFPISEKMRYLVPFREVRESLQCLESAATEEGDRCVVLMDDGEKFGGWPDTYHWVYEEGWLEKFLTALEENASWITTSTFSEFASSHPPLGRISLPTASYSEMGEWSLPPDAAREYEGIRGEIRERGEMPRFERFLKGGFWRNFLAKYDESNHLHKKMLWVSGKVEEARRRLGKKASARKREVLERAEAALYRGECNCPYWHGVFGGLYLNHLRYGVYRQLIEAEKLAESLLPSPKRGFTVRVEDFNKDGFDEIVVEGKGFHAVLDPAAGGALSELDYLKNPINLSDTLTRRKEAYHDKLLAAAQGHPGGGNPASIHDRVRVKEPGLEQKLYYDRDRRVSLVERFLPVTTSVEDLLAGRNQDWGDFHRSSYDFEVIPPKKKGGELRVNLLRQGLVWDEPGGLPVGLSKKLAFAPGDFRLRADYKLQNNGSRAASFLFAVEWNLTLLAGDAPDRNYFVKGRSLSQSRLVSRGEELSVTQMGMTDGWSGLRVVFETPKPARFWRYPVETVSQSEGGFERVYQGSCLLLVWEVSLPPGGTFETRADTRLEETA